MTNVGIGKNGLVIMDPKVQAPAFEKPVGGFGGALMQGMFAAAPLHMRDGKVLLGGAELAVNTDELTSSRISSQREWKKTSDVVGIKAAPNNFSIGKSTDFDAKNTLASMQTLESANTRATTNASSVATLQNMKGHKEYSEGDFTFLANRTITSSTPYVPGDTWQRMLIPFTNLQRVGKLGRGSTASVYKCNMFMPVQNGDTSTFEVAYKVFGELKTSAEQTSKLRTAFIEEIKMLSQLSHPYIISIIGWTEKPLGIVCELCSRGTLLQLYKSTDKSLYTRERVMLILFHTALGMDYLHSWKPQP